MKEGGYLLLEKENREIIIFDVLKFSLEENLYSNRIIGGDILIKLNSHGYYKLIDIYEFPDSIGRFKSIKFDDSGLEPLNTDVKMYAYLAATS